MTSSTATAPRLRSGAAPAHPTRRDRRIGGPPRSSASRIASYLVLLVLWGVSVAGPVSHTLTMDRSKAVEGVKTTIAQAVVDAWWVAFLIPAAITAFLLIFRVAFIRNDVTPLLCALIPWLWIVFNEFAHGRPVAEQVLLPMGVAVTLWALRVRIGDLRLYALLATALAAVSMALTSVVPRLMYMPQSFDSATEKSLTGLPLLAGFFSHPNGNGLFLVLALPLTHLFARWYLRWTTATVLIVALVWTASRTALFSVIVWLVIVILQMLVRRTIRQVLCALLLVLAIAVVVVPLSTTDPAAFTLRGAIWQFNLAQLSGDHWLDGLGHSWYTDHYDLLKDALTSAAGHGHNVFVTYTVTGGLILVATFGFVLYRCARIGSRLASRESVATLGFLCVLAGVSITESAWRVEAPDDLFAAMLVPLFVIATQSALVSPVVGSRATAGGETLGELRDFSPRSDAARSR